MDLKSSPTIAHFTNIARIGDSLEIGYVQLGLDFPIRQMGFNFFNSLWNMIDHKKRRFIQTLCINVFNTIFSSTGSTLQINTGCTTGLLKKKINLFHY